MRAEIRRKNKVALTPASEPITVESIEQDLRDTFGIIQDELITASEYIASDASRLAKKLKQNPKCCVSKNGELQGLVERHLRLCAEYATYFTILEMFDKLKQQENSND